MEYFYMQSAIVTSSHKLCGHHYFLFHLLLMHVHIPTHPYLCTLKYKIQNCKSFASDVRCDIYTPLMFRISVFVFVMLCTVVK